MLLNCGTGEDSRVSWTARRSNQSILKEINPEYSLKIDPEAPIFWPPEEPTLWNRPWCWERLKAKGKEVGRGWDGRMASLIQWTWTQSLGDGEGQAGQKCRSPWGHRVRHGLATEQRQQKISFGGQLFNPLHKQTLEKNLAFRPCSFAILGHPDNATL